MIETHIIDGRLQAADLDKETSIAVQSFISTHGRAPELHVIMVGHHAPSQIYVRKKKELAEELGMVCHIHSFDNDVTTQAIINKIEILNDNSHVNGIIVQLPLPDHIDKKAVQNAIHDRKDVDGLNDINVKLRQDNDSGALIPCTGLGVLHLIRSVKKDIAGVEAHVIGRSAIVGQPCFDLLKSAGCNVMQSHRGIDDIPSISSKADILIVATGQIEMVTREWVKEGAIVIDVGIHHKVDGTRRITGDCLYDDLVGHAGALTPVPGGVGPMTVSYLMHNTIRAAELQIN